MIEITKHVENMVAAIGFLHSLLDSKRHTVKPLERGHPIK